MFTKIYEFFKKFIKNNYKEIILYFVLVLFLLIKLPFYIYIGGGLIDLSDRIDLESNEKGSYHLAYVKQMQATIPTYLLAHLIPTWNLESMDEMKMDDSESVQDLDRREKLYLEEANAHAIMNAYKLAGKEIIMKDANYKVIYISKESNTNIEVGDILVSVNGISVSNNAEYKAYLKTLNEGDILDVKVIRDEKEVSCHAKLISLNGEKVIGLYLVNIYDYEVSPPINLKFKRNESGPSGGFMLSLAIYDRLISDDLTKGLKIAGTGTIDALGHVGEIGGVEYKLMGAVSKKADLFFVPKENYEKAIETKNKFHYQIKVIPVETLEEAVNYLKKY